jgi:hypothetical protein
MARMITSRTEQTYRYDFALDGGTAAAHALRGPRLPSGAVVVDALLIIDTVLAGGTGTDDVRLDVEGTGDVQATGDRTAAVWTTLGAKRVSLTATSAPVRLTADRQPSLVVVNTALTDGKFRLVLTVVEVV